MAGHRGAVARRRDRWTFADQTGDRFGDIRDASLSPASDLVAEDPESSGPSHADGTFRDDPTPLAVPVRDGRLLDDEVAFGNVDHERRVIQVATLSSLHECGDRLEQLAADLHDVGAGTERDPVEVDGSRSFVGSSSDWSSAVMGVGHGRQRLRSRDRPVVSRCGRHGPTVGGARERRGRCRTRRRRPSRCTRSPGSCRCRRLLASRWRG